MRSRFRKGPTIDSSTDILFAMVMVMSVVLVVARIDEDSCIAALASSSSQEDQVTTRLTLEVDGSGAALQAGARSWPLDACEQALDSQVLVVSIPLDGSVDAPMVAKALSCARALGSEDAIIRTGFR